MTHEAPVHSLRMQCNAVSANARPSFDLSKTSNKCSRRCSSSGCRIQCRLTLREAQTLVESALTMTLRAFFPTPFLFLSDRDLQLFDHSTARSIASKRVFRTNPTLLVYQNIPHHIEYHATSLLFGKTDLSTGVAREAMLSCISNEDGLKYILGAVCVVIRIWRRRSRPKHLMSRKKFGQLRTPQLISRSGAISITVGSTLPFSRH